MFSNCPESSGTIHFPLSLRIDSSNLIVRKVLEQWKIALERCDSHVLCDEKWFELLDMLQSIYRVEALAAVVQDLDLER